MKKTLIKFTLFATLLTQAFMLAGCQSKDFGSNAPINFVGSVWKSENGIITFQIDENHRAIGTLLTAGGPVDVFIMMYGSSEFSIFPIELKDATSIPFDSMIEDWGADFYATDEFSVYVRNSTYFSKGDTFIVRCVRNGA